jgi:hypothetical protein
VKVLTASLKALTNGEKVNYLINHLIYSGDSHVSAAQDSMVMVKLNNFKTQRVLLLINVYPIISILATS